MTQDMEEMRKRVAELTEKVDYNNHLTENLTQQISGVGSDQKALRLELATHNKKHEDDMIDIRQGIEDAKQNIKDTKPIVEEFNRKEAELRVIKSAGGKVIWWAQVVGSVGLLLAAFFASIKLGLLQFVSPR